MPFGLEKLFSLGGKGEDNKNKPDQKPQAIGVEKEPPPVTVEKEARAEAVEPQLHGFKIGDTVLLGTPLKEDNIFAAKEVKISGPAKNPDQIQIKMDNPDSPFGPKLVYEVYPSDLINLNEHEQRMVRQLGMQEVKLFKNALVQIEKTKEQIADSKSRHTFDRAMEDQSDKLRRAEQQLKDEILKEKFDRQGWEKIKQEVWDVLGKIPDMLANIEENYPSDDWERARRRRQER